MKYLFAFLIMLSAISHSFSQSEVSEITHITNSLMDYIEGSTNGQPDRLKKVFHPELNLYSVRNNELSTWTGTAYIADTKEGQPTGETGKILSIDYENNAAVAKVKIHHPESGSSLIDYFMLLKINDQWTIIHKMYTRELAPTRE